ncbi:MAG: tyrosine-type recombinase/integrase [Pseudomonadales bacterium]|jgi:integrase
MKLLSKYLKLTPATSPQIADLLRQVDNISASALREELANQLLSAIGSSKTEREKTQALLVLKAQLREKKAKHPFTSLLVTLSELGLFDIANVVLAALVITDPTVTSETLKQLRLFFQSQELSRDEWFSLASYDELLAKISAHVGDCNALTFLLNAITNLLNSELSDPSEAEVLPSGSYESRVSPSIFKEFEELTQDEISAIHHYLPESFNNAPTERVVFMIMLSFGLTPDAAIKRLPLESDKLSINLSMPANVYQSQLLLDPITKINLPVPSEIITLADDLNAKDVSFSLDRLKRCVEVLRMLHPALQNVKLQRISSQLELKTSKTLRCTIATHIVGRLGNSKPPLLAHYVALSESAVIERWAQIQTQLGFSVPKYPPELLDGVYGTRFSDLFIPLIKSEISRLRVPTGRSVEDLITYHNNFVTYCAAAFATATGVRPIRGWFGSWANFDLCNRRVLLQDKGAASLRVVLLCDTAVRQVESLKIHLKRLASRLSKFNTEAIPPRIIARIWAASFSENSKRMPFFTLRLSDERDIKLEPLSPTSLSFGKQIPHNWARKLLAHNLYEQVSPNFCREVLGHADVVPEIFGKHDHLKEERLSDLKKVQEKLLRDLDLTVWESELPNRVFLPEKTLNLARKFGQDSKATSPRQVKPSSALDSAVVEYLSLKISTPKSEFCSQKSINQVELDRALKSYKAKSLNKNYGTVNRSDFTRAKLFAPVRFDDIVRHVRSTSSHLSLNTKLFVLAIILIIRHRISNAELLATLINKLIKEKITTVVISFGAQDAYAFEFDQGVILVCRRLLETSKAVELKTDELLSLQDKRFSDFTVELLLRQCRSANKFDLPYPLARFLDGGGATPLSVNMNFRETNSMRLVYQPVATSFSGTVLPSSTRASASDFIKTLQKISDLDQAAATRKKKIRELAEATSHSTNQIEFHLAHWTIEMIDNGGEKKTSLKTSTIAHYLGSVNRIISETFMSLDDQESISSKLIDYFRKRPDGPAAAFNAFFTFLNREFLFDLPLRHEWYSGDQSQVSRNSTLTEYEYLHLVRLLVQTNRFEEALAAILMFRFALRKNEARDLRLRDFFYSFDMKMAVLRLVPTRARELKSGQKKLEVALCDLFEEEASVLEHHFEYFDKKIRNNRNVRMFCANSAQADQLFGRLRQSYLEVSGDPLVVHHSLRHSSAHRAVNVTAAMKLLGHTSIDSTTQTYVHRIIESQIKDHLDHLVSDLAYLDLFPVIRTTTSMRIPVNLPEGRSHKNEETLLRRTNHTRH